jgi:large subunit ribosomal protein L13
MSTYFDKNIDQNKKSWFLFDAKGKVLGRLATEIATVLTGKHKPTYTPHVDTGDFVIVVNSGQVEMTGKKWTDKLYYDHSGYVGGLKIKAARDLHDKHPDDLIRRAVWGMVNKTKLGRAQMTKLKIYAGAEHPHKAQKVQPWSAPKRTVARPTASTTTKKSK